MKVTEADILEIMDNSDVEAITMGTKTTVVKLVTPSGFAIIESSSCVDPANYDMELGKQLCLNRIKNKLWEFEGYVLQKNQEQKEDGSFENAVKLMKEGYAVAHKDFPGDGFWIWSSSEKNILICTKDGEVIRLTDTKDVPYTLGFITSPKWFAKGTAQECLRKFFGSKMIMVDK